MAPTAAPARYYGADSCAHHGAHSCGYHGAHGRACGYDGAHHRCAYHGANRYDGSGARFHQALGFPPSG